MILAAFLGMIVGIIVGMVPGVSVTVIMLMLLPVLQNFDLLVVMIFYFSLLITTQYFGSMTAITFGVPGEISSVPAVTHGHRLMRQHQGSLALASSATSSMMAGVMACALLMVVYFNTGFLSLFFNTAFLTVLYLLVLLTIALTAEHRVLGIVLLITGLVLGKVGFDSLHGMTFIVPEYGLLENGIPFMPLFTGFLIAPMLIEFLRKQSVPEISVRALDLGLRKRFQALLDYHSWPSVLRGTAIGSVVGLIPGASYLLSSAVAQSLEKRVTGDNDLKQLVAAESANNSGCITVLIPLLIFAIPIVPSEAIVLSIAESKGFGSSSSLQFIEHNLPMIVSVLVAVNLVNWIVAGVFYQALSWTYEKLQRYIYATMLAVCTGVMLWLAWIDNQIIVTAVIFVVAWLLGSRIQGDRTKAALIFGFFLSDTVLDEIYRFGIIYF